MDIWLTNKPAESGLDDFGPDILVECKSSKDPLGALVITHFATQAARRRLRWSIIVSLAGLTGDPDDLRAAHSEIRDSFGEKDLGILVLVERELRAVRSPQHLANVLDGKRRLTIYRLTASELSDAQLRDLDPEPADEISGGGAVVEVSGGGAVTARSGMSSIRDAIRHAQDAAVRLILKAARDLPKSDDPAERAAAALRALSTEVEAHKADPAAEPFMRTVRDRVVDVGAAFATLLDEPLDGPDAERAISSDVRTLAPQRLRASVGGELWTILTDYYARTVAEYRGVERHKSAIAVIAMAAEEIIAIDDIDPRDVYDDYD